MEATTSAKTPVYSGCERLIPSAAGVRPDVNHEHVPDIRLLVVRSDPIKRNVKRKVLSIGPMPMFLSRHSAQPFERGLREWSPSGPEVVVRLHW